VQKEVKTIVEKVRGVIAIEIMEKFQHAHKYIYFYKAHVCIVEYLDISRADLTGSEFWWHQEIFYSKLGQKIERPVE
jgi:hypothetical protein